MLSVIHLKGVNYILVRTIKNQLKLKPIYYRQVSKVAGVGCILGILISVAVIEGLLNSFGFDTEQPIRQMDTLIAVSGLLVMFLLFISILCLSVICTGFMFYSVKSMHPSSSINIYQVRKLVLKGEYPNHWYKDV
jgi:hypothetical protein